jgi:hypothetical protein
MFDKCDNSACPPECSITLSVLPTQTNPGQSLNVSANAVCKKAPDYLSIGIWNPFTQQATQYTCTESELTNCTYSMEMDVPEDTKTGKYIVNSAANIRAGDKWYNEYASQEVEIVKPSCELTFEASPKKIAPRGQITATATLNCSETVYDIEISIMQGPSIFSFESCRKGTSCSTTATIEGENTEVPGTYTLTATARFSDTEIQTLSEPSGNFYTLVKREEYVVEESKPCTLTIEPSQAEIPIAGSKKFAASLSCKDWDKVKDVSFNVRCTGPAQCSTLQILMGNLDVKASIPTNATVGDTGAVYVAAIVDLGDYGTITITKSANYEVVAAEPLSSEAQEATCFFTLTYPDEAEPGKEVVIEITYYCTSGAGTVVAAPKNSLWFPEYNPLISFLALRPLPVHIRMKESYAEGW